MNDLFAPITSLQFLEGDAREVLSRMGDETVQCCVTSPPYFGLRDYGHEDQIGLEKTPKEFIENLVKVFAEVHRIMKHDGIPWMFAFAMRDFGWYLRQEIIWHKPNPMPESVRDRCTKAHETIFMFTKSERYSFDHEAIKEPAVKPEGAKNKKHKNATAYANGDVKLRLSGGLANTKPSETRNKRSVWTVATSRFKGAHFATFPPELVEPCVLSSSRPGDVVLDPFGGSGTINMLCQQHDRNGIYIDCNPDYIKLAKGRVQCPTL